MALPRLRFDRGTVVAEEMPSAVVEGLSEIGFTQDRRVGHLRAPAYRYREAMLLLRREQVEVRDEARAYRDLELDLRLIRDPFPHQREAVEAWWAGGRAGTVVLPTGSGKTYVAQLVMERVRRSTLVVTPTLDLMRQWYGVLGTSFDLPVGLLGGGYHEPEEVTVTTYDSAYLHMERLGARFGLVVFDECHHLPGRAYSQAAEMCVAPFRLGLTATPEREDGREILLPRLLGPELYRRGIHELAGEYLADYETRRLEVDLSEEEREAYLTARTRYREFVQRHGLALGAPGGWARFLRLTSASREGREAFLAYREQKRIAQASEAKLRLLEQLLVQHRRDRALIFTSDNATVYDISRRFLVPAITHQTKIKERHRLLEAFNSGDLPFLVTSRVLNEGVDVPAANVGIVLSGSGSVREHVQRLGRILRRGKEKSAILYEVVARDTGEEHVSHRRRRHRAYQ